MAITTYAELQTAAANWLVRSDLAARIPEFIALGEVRLNRVLRARRAETESTLTGVVGSRNIVLPATYSEALNLWIVRSGDREALNYRDPVLMEASDTNGEPEYWGIDGTNLTFERPCDQAYSFVLRFLAKFVLSDAAPTNALLTDAPDAYLFATLCEAGPFLRDSELLNSFESKLSRSIRELNAKDGRAKSMQTLSTEPGRLISDGSRDGFDINRGW